MTQKIDNIILTSLHDHLDFGVDVHFEATQTPKPVVVFIHGFNGFKDWGHFNLIAQAFAEAGFVFIKFNLSHNGTTVLRPTEFVNLEAYGNDKFSTDLDDIRVVIEYLHQADCHFASEMDLGKINLIGHSRGGALAILGAGENTQVQKTAAWASIASTMHFWTPENIEIVSRKGVIYVPNGRTKQNLPLYYAYYEDIVLNSERLDVETCIKHLDKPVLLVHGSGDTSVSIAKSQQLKAWQPKAEVCIVENANHTFGGTQPFSGGVLPEDSQKLVQTTIDFFRK
jgi:dienelactone hydrolase